MMARKFHLSVVGVLAAAVAAAAPVRVEVAHPERYACGDVAVFDVSLGDSKGCPTSGLVTAVLTDYGTKVVSSNVFDLADGPSFSVSGTLDEPGFLLLTLSGDAVDRNWGGGTFVTSVAYEPEKVRGGEPKPVDFDAYWDGELERLEREVPLDVRSEPCEGYSDGRRVLSRVSFATFGGRRVWGFLSEPRDRSRGPFPTRVNVPGAGPGQCAFNAEGGADEIVLHLNVHYFEPAFERGGNAALQKDEERRLSEALGLEPRTYPLIGVERSREDCFYHDAVVGLVRAVNWLYGREGVDRSRFTYEGTSQGGGFGLILAGLSGRFTRVVAYVPALCDPCGYKVGRRAGWPRFNEFAGYAPGDFARAEAVAPYFDAAHFASRITCPIRFVVGLADSVCPPASGTSACNACPSADKRLVLVPHMTHTVFKDQYRRWNEWSRKGVADRGDVFRATVRGLGGAEFRLADGGSLSFSFSYPDRGPNAGGIQRDEHSYISYSERMRRQREHLPMPDNTPISNCVVRLTAPQLMKRETTLFLLPYFHSSYGLYSHDDIVRNLSFWRSVYPAAREREYEIAFVPDVEKRSTSVWLDGSVLTATNAVLDVESVTVSRGLELVRSGRSPVVCPAGQHLLPKLAVPSRASDLLKEGASLSIPPGIRTVGGVTMDVWSVTDSVDQGRHHRTSSRRSLCADPQYDREPWKTGYEYLQWRIPGGTWSHAWVLCADVPQEGREPVVGVQLSKLGRGCTGGNIDAESVTLEGAAKVGELTYGGGLKTPLRLVRVDLDSARLGARGNGQTALDFEFTGGGAMGSSVRSSVQIFGCTLVEAPYAFEVSNPVRGNVFEQGTDGQRCGFTVVANNDDVRGSVEYEVYDPLFRTLDRGVKTFSVAKRGEAAAVGLDLSAYGVGWYGMDFVFRDETGKVLFRHEAAFTVLAPDTREAGYESPYAAWPHSNGYHGSNPDPMGPRTVMRKAGYRTSWEPPVASEEEGRPWKIGLNTLGYKCCQPGKPTKTRGEFDARLDRQVELVRRQAEAFPHAQVVQLLHEQGGRQISTEVATGAKGVRGEYRGWDFATGVGDWEVFYCTEWAKRIRREFPGKKIMIGNGSSSCEKIASLVRRGFDLDLVDQLGIESKGFGTMPEYCANQESPGMLWALRETGRAFGYTNFTLNACNEYVFRTERTVSRDWPKRKIMSVTDFTLRDYLISMAHGCTIISTGHLEDAADAYYDTNWGAGGQCKAYPYSYPKRMFTALAVLTRVIDCPEFLRRVPTGDNTAIVFEFRRNRRTKDYAYALWTPTHDAEVEVAFPDGAKVTLTETFGSDCVFATNRLVIGSSPRYLVSSAPIESVKVVDYLADAVPADAREIFRPTAENLVQLDEAIQDRRGYWGVPDATNGTFRTRTVRDAKLGEVFEVEHVKDDRRIPAVVWEGRNYGLARPVKLRLSELRGFGLWIRGNGSYGKVKLLLSKPDNKYLYEIECGNRGYVTFSGWQYVDMSLSEWTPACGWLRDADEVTLEKIQIGTTRVALDPVEMRPTVGDVAVGPVYALPKAGVTSVSVEESQSRRAWENTEDRDR